MHPRQHPIRQPRPAHDDGGSLIVRSGPEPPSASAVSSLSSSGSLWPFGGATFCTVRTRPSESARGQSGPSELPNPLLPPCPRRCRVDRQHDRHHVGPMHHPGSSTGTTTIPKATITCGYVLPNHRRHYYSPLPFGTPVLRTKIEFSYPATTSSAKPTKFRSPKTATLPASPSPSGRPSHSPTVTLYTKYPSCRHEKVLHSARMRAVCPSSAKVGSGPPGSTNTRAITTPPLSPPPTNTTDTITKHPSNPKPSY